MYEKDTEELLSNLQEDGDIRSFLAESASERLLPLAEYLAALLKEKGLTKSEAIRRADIDQAYGYHIFDGTKQKPSRQKLLPLALAMGLSLKETQRLLRHAGAPALYPRDSWDAVIITALREGLSVMETNALLTELGEQKLLG